jgi:DNA-directed RNA polymerase specialized sigma24 family protein
MNGKSVSTKSDLKFTEGILPHMATAIAAGPANETTLIETLYERLRPLAGRLSYIDRLLDGDDLLHIAIVEVLKVLRSGKRSDIPYLYGTGKIAMLHELKQRRSDVFFVSLEQYTSAGTGGEETREIAAPETCPIIPAREQEQRRRVFDVLSYLNGKQRMAIMARFAIEECVDRPCATPEEVQAQYAISHERYQLVCRQSLYAMRQVARAASLPYVYSNS